MPCWRARPRWPQQGKDIINLGIGQPDFKTPAAYRRGGDQGAARRPSRLYAGQRAAGDARGGGAPHADDDRRRGVARESVMILPGGKPTMYAAIIMFGEPGAEILYPDPGFPIYRSMIEFTGATPIPVPMREENGFAFSARRDAGADHAEDQAADPQLAGQPDRRRHAARRDREAGRRGWRRTRTSRSCPTRSTTS